MKRKILFFVCAMLLSVSVALFAACSSAEKGEFFDMIASQNESGYIADSDNNFIDESIQGETDTNGGSETEAAAPVEEKSNDSELYILALTSSLNIRKEASVSSAALGVMDKGDMLPYYGKVNGFYKTFYLGKDAYVSANSSYTKLYEMKISGSEKVESVIAVAKTLMGYPYVYGATRYHNGNGKLLTGFDSAKYDCSSLTQYAYYVGAGVKLGLTTRDQVNQGKSVSKANLKRGDLMFFTNSSRKNLTGIERVGHVAIYLGDNYILHTASDHAVIEQISQTRWSYYITSRDVL